MRLLIVDGSNVVMRASFGGDISPARALPVASGIIERATRELEASHLVVALDGPKSGPSWRREIYPAYKANRDRDTTPWLAAASAAWNKQGSWVEECAGFEADDVIATIALRAVAAGFFASVMVVSGDSDLLPLMAVGVEIIKPVNGGNFHEVNTAEVVAKYGLPPKDLPQLKALTGEAGDNVPGVDGIGPVRALRLLFDHGDLEAIIAHGQGPLRNRYSTAVAAQAEMARLALRLVTLRTDAPVVPISPKGCAL